MALQGTIKDFGLADILQLIGIQRKTGILSLANEEEQVQLKFLEGSVVGAEGGEQSSEDLLGNVLVRTGRITEQQLNDALATQKRTLQRVGHILVKRGCISEEELVEALRVQSLQIIFRLFRWRDGTYQVQMVEDLDYDEKHATPISSETILMEGARMVDEWPIIERKIRSEHVILEKTAAALELGADQAEAEPVPSLLDTGAEFDFIFEPDEAAGAQDEDDGAVRLSDAEREVLDLIDGKRSVGDVSDRSSLGEFETYRTLADLVSRDLLAEVEKVRKATSTGTQRGWVGATVTLVTSVVLVAVVGFSLATLHLNAFAPWKTFQQGELEGLRSYAAMSRLEKIDQAVRVYFLDSGVFPVNLRQLEGDYLRSSDLLDPWGRHYGYLLDSEGYRVYGHDSAGQPDPELSVVHRFTTLQRMMTESLQGSAP